MSKRKSKAEAALEAAIAEETRELQAQIAAKDREIGALRNTLARICQIAGGVPVAQKADVEHPTAPEDEIREGPPPEARPKAVFEEPKAEGPEVPLHPGDPWPDEGRFV